MGVSGIIFEEQFFKMFLYLNHATMKNCYSAYADSLCSILVQGIKAAVDLIIPRKCTVCGKRLFLQEKYLCIYCEADIPFTHYWDRTHNPMSDKLNEQVQREITDESLSEEYSFAHVKYSYAAALFFYNGETGYKHIPRSLKYHGDLNQGKFYSRILGRMLSSSACFDDVDLIIPVPLHWMRHWRRGYNQAEIIAKAISSEMDVPVRMDIIGRGKYTKTQTKLSVSDKYNNVRKAFMVKGKALCRQRNMPATHSGYRHVLVVDDVFTTGATMCSCIRALQAYFGKEVRISAVTLGYVGSW